MHERTIREIDIESLTISELMEEVALEAGTTPSILTQNLLNQRKRLHNMIANNEGKYRVVGVDTYDQDDWIDAEFNTPEEAQEYVREKTLKYQAAPNVTGLRWNPSLGDMVRYSETSYHFYAYTPEGIYLEPLPLISHEQNEALS